VTERALDLRPAELSAVVPLVLLLVGLSAWPALISDRSFPHGAAKASIDTGLQASPGYEITQAKTAVGSGP
jgi:hypothetical protein